MTLTSLIRMAAGVGISSMLVACGGGSSSSSSTPANTAQSGIFIDDPVAGVFYTTTSNPEGAYTDSNGGFSYEPGDRVRFYVGSILLGEAAASDLITPLELAGSSDINNDVVLNIAQLLQSLDDNPNDNVITISESIHTAFNGQALDVTSINFDSELQSVMDLNQLGTLISEQSASANLDLSFKNNIAPASNYPFTLAQISGQSFYILGDLDDRGTPDEADSTWIAEFETDGTGSFTSYSSTDSSDFTWLIKADGRLFIHETSSDSNDYWDITLTAVSKSGDDLTIQVKEQGMEDGEPVSETDTILMYSENRYPGYSIDLTTKIATSVVTTSTCASYDRQAGFYYSFTETKMTRTGTDNIDDDNSSCQVNNPEIQQFEMSSLGTDFDIPFNCDNYPVCTYEDFNKTVSYVTEGQTVTSTYTHTPGSNTILYQSVFPSGYTITEVLTLDAISGGSTLDLTEYDVSSTITNSDCQGTVLGWDMTFNPNSVTFDGSDGFSGNCVANEDEVFTESTSVLLAYEGNFFTCIDYPVCTLAELNRTYIGKDYDGDDDVVITISHQPGSSVLTVVQEELLGSTWTEVVTFGPKSDDSEFVVPETFSIEWLQGKTLYDVWYGREDGFAGDDARLARITFNADGTAHWTGLVQSNVDASVSFTVDSQGRLYFADDVGNRFTISYCASNSDYLEIIYTENGELNNIDRFYFKESDALAYVQTLTDSIPQTNCSANSYAFTAQELENFTFYFALLEPQDCGNNWVVEEMNFNSSVYSLDVCGLGLGDEENEQFILLESGVVQLVSHAEYVNRVGFDAQLNAYLVCWSDTEQDALSCSEEEQGIAFLSRQDAENYVQAQNSSSGSGFSNLTAGTYRSQVGGDAFPTDFVLEANGTGEWIYDRGTSVEGGSVTWMVSSDGVLVIDFTGGGTEEVTLVSGTYLSGTVDVWFSNEDPVSGASWMKISE